MKMKHSKLFIASLITLIALSSCQDNKKKTETVPTQNNAKINQETEIEDLNQVSESSNPEFKNEVIAAVYDDYSQLKAAFVNTKASEAQNAARTLLEDLKKVEASKQAIEVTQKIAATQDINEQRNAFVDLGEPMEKLLSGNLVSGEIYKQYCPMAFEGKGGYWLASSKEIRNPYFGDKMLKCGSVRDTLL